MTDRPTAADTPLLPYASPTPLAAQGDLIRDALLLIARDGTTLPPRCILCNKDAAPQQMQNPLKLKFSWDPSFKVTHAPSTLELRRAGFIHAYLCPVHYRNWRNGRLLGIAGMIACTLLMLAASVLAILSEIADIPLYSPHALVALLIGFALFIIFLFLFTLKTRTLACTRIHEGYLYLAGAHESFLATLPPLPQTLNPGP
jgi:hypothetical protein